MRELVEDRQHRPPIPPLDLGEWGRRTPRLVPETAGLRGDGAESTGKGPPSGDVPEADDDVAELVAQRPAQLHDGGAVAFLQPLELGGVFGAELFERWFLGRVVGRCQHRDLRRQPRSSS